jgi:lysozyme family protein
LELIADQVVLDMVFDCLVNPGPGAGAKIVQQAINHYFNKQVLAEDGCIGMDTITRMNGIPSSELLPRIRASRCQYYFRVASSRGQSIYLYGWLIRACS